MTSLSVDTFVNISSFLSYQHFMQVSRLNRDSYIASRISEERADRAATIIQRRVRKWQGLVRFAWDLVLRTDGNDRFFQTPLGKRVGKRLFLSRYFRCMKRYKNTCYIELLFKGSIIALQESRNLLHADRLKVYALEDELTGLDWERRFGKDLSAVEGILWKLVEQVILPYIEREGCGHIYKIPIMWC